MNTPSVEDYLRVLCDPHSKEKAELYLYKIGAKTPPMERTYEHEDYERRIDKILKKKGRHNYYPLVPAVAEPSDDSYSKRYLIWRDISDEEFTDFYRGTLLFKYTISDSREIFQYRGFGRFINAEYFDYLFCDTDIVQLTNYSHGQLLGIYTIYQSDIPHIINDVYPNEKINNQAALLKAGMYTNALYVITMLRYIPNNVWNAIPLELSLKIAMYLPPPFKILT